MVVSDCITINKENPEEIRQAKRLIIQKKVRSFLELANYYRDHISSFAVFAAPQSDLTRKGLPENVRCEDSQAKAFAAHRDNLLRNRYCDCLNTLNRLFTHERFERRLGDAKPCWEESIIPWRMKQEIDVSRAEIFHFGKKMPIVIVCVVYEFRLYLADKPFILRTDHQLLTFLNDAKFKNDRIIRWVLSLQVFRGMTTP